MSEKKLSDNKFKNENENENRNETKNENKNEEKVFFTQVKKLFKEELKSVLTVSLFIGTIVLFLCFNLFSESKKYSVSERRELKRFPVVSLETVMNGKFMDDFESASLDQFVFRDGFRSLKAFVNKYVYLKPDNHDIYKKDGYLAKLEYPRNETNFERNLNTISKIYEEKIKGTDCKSYISIIPDKNYYLVKNQYPSMDYEQLFTDIKNQTTFLNYIDISDELSIENFYYTDQHWKQETLIPVSEKILKEMDVNVDPDRNFTKVDLNVPFYGTYASQYGLTVKPDKLSYMTNSDLMNCKVVSFGTGDEKEIELYDVKKTVGRDPYEMFLNGSDPLLVIENLQAKSDKELVIFRDSFGSSLVPLFLPSYKKITVVDLRYMNYGILDEYVTFDSQDVLFMYSTLILNNVISKQ